LDEAHDDAGEEFRRDLEQTVRLKRVVTRRPHVMQVQDRADAAEYRLQDGVGAAEIQSLEAAADDRAFRDGQFQHSDATEGVRALIRNPLPSQQTKRGSSVAMVTTACGKSARVPTAQCSKFDILS